jgi:hypothetical protein
LTQTELDTLSQRATKSATDFPNKPRQLLFITDYSYELLQLMVVWNALKTSRNVLGADMPMAEEAQKFEARVEEVLMQGVQALDQLVMREGEKLRFNLADYIKDGIEKCR